MMLGGGLTETLAAFATETSKMAFPAGVIENAKQLVLDTIGVAIAASNRKMGRLLVRHAKEVSPAPGSATIIGSGMRTSPELAALANGAMAHALALDGGKHLPTHILPAALALTEHLGLSGAALLDSIIIAYEAGDKITRTIGRGPTDRGWWHVGFVGPIAATIAAGRLLQIDRQTMMQAIGIATCSSAGLRANMGTMSQAYHSGLAARAGLEAARLARAGFSAERHIIEAPLGFLQTVGGADLLDETHISRHLGAPYALEKPYQIKPLPVCGPGQALVEATMTLLQQASFGPGDVASIEADLHFFSLLRPEPTDEDAAGYSGAFAIAAAIVFGEVWIDQISDETVADPRIKALISRVRHRPSTVKGNEVVDVELHDGRKLSATITGGRKRSDASEVAVGKFRRCASRVLQIQAVDELQALICDIDKLQRVDRLMQIAGCLQDVSPASC